MVINPVCYSWICEIPCGARLPLKLVTEFVTEFCDRTWDQIVTNFPVKSSCTLLNTTGSLSMLYPPHHYFLFIYCHQDWWLLEHLHHPLLSCYVWLREAALLLCRSSTSSTNTIQYYLPGQKFHYRPPHFLSKEAQQDRFAKNILFVFNFLEVGSIVRII